MSGPHEKAAIVGMLAAGELNGTEQVAIDRRSWKPLAMLVGPALPRPPARPPAPPAAAGVVARPAHVDLSGGLDLPPAIEAPGATRAPAPKAEPGDLRLSELAPARPDIREPGPGLDVGEDGGLSLELVERKPPARPAAGPPPAAVSVAAPAPAAELSAVPELVSLGASSRGAVTSLDDDSYQPDPTMPVSIDGAPGDKKAVRPRTVTAARAGAMLEKKTEPKRLRRLVIPATVVVVLGALAAAAVVLDLPARLRPEPQIAAVLGTSAQALAHDRFAAYSEAARKLEDAGATRKQAPRLRARAALLLASSVVIHGGERGRLAHAEALLAEAEAGATEAPEAAAALTRARAWLALGKGRLKEAVKLAGDAAVPAADQAALRGWAALGRQDAPVAEAAFEEALRAAPAPSTLATRYGLALAQEAANAPAAAPTYRAILAEAPAHVGASLGLLRTSPLAPTGRLKLAQALIATQVNEASRVELAEAHVRVAEAARALGDLATADAARARARQADPSSPALAVDLGDQALAEGRREDAFASYKTTLTAPPATPRTPAFQFARVGALVDAGRFDEAALALTQLEKSLPANPRTSYWRGQLAERRPTPELTAAQQAYEDALKRDAKFVPASLDLARLRLGQHRPADALAVLKRAEGQGAAPVALRIALGEALLESGNPTEAVRVFRQAVAEDPRNGAAHLGYANALYGAGDAGAAGTEVTALAARADPAKLGPRIGELLVKLGRRDEALAFYQRQIAAGGTAPALRVAAARLALERGQRDVAQALVEAVIAEDPRTPGALFVLGEALRAKGDLAGAIAELRRAQAVDGSPDVQLEYGRVLASMGRDEEALAALAETGDLPEANLERGRIALRRGNTEKAVEELTVATAKLPANAEAFLLLGQAEDRQGHGPQAEAAFKTTARLAPAVGEARYRLGRMLLDRGAVAAALPHLRAAVEHLPPTASWRADAYFQLGFAERRQGSRDRAVAAFRRYLELAPGDAPARAEVLKQLSELGP
ncbi:MAG TPA: tetratricopeptide repeat protein [Polyangia bacterium]